MKRIRIRSLGFPFLLNTALLAALVAALIWRFAAPAAQPSPPPARAAASLPPVTEGFAARDGGALSGDARGAGARHGAARHRCGLVSGALRALRRDPYRLGGYADAAAVEAALQAMELDPEGKMVALTFDDGPDPRHTPQVLALLRQYNARATFFIVGRTSPATRPSLGRSWAAAARSATTRRRTRTCAM